MSDRVPYRIPREIKIPQADPPVDPRTGLMARSWIAVFQAIVDVIQHLAIAAVYTAAKGPHVTLASVPNTDTIVDGMVVTIDREFSGRLVSVDFSVLASLAQNTNFGDGPRYRVYLDDVPVCPSAAGDAGSIASVPDDSFPALLQASAAGVVVKLPGGPPDDMDVHVIDVRVRRGATTGSLVLRDRSLVVTVLGVDSLRLDGSVGGDTGSATQHSGGGGGSGGGGDCSSCVPGDIPAPTTPAWFTALLTGAGATNCYDPAILDSIEASLNAAGYYIQRTSGCVVRARIFYQPTGPIVVQCSGHLQATDFSRYVNVSRDDCGWGWDAHGV